MPDAPNERI